jgi:hypothetical protein
MIATGTNYFVSEGAAMVYYRAYGLWRTDVENKITRGEIHIGPPPLKPGQRAVLNVDEGRYFIHEREKK